MKLKSVKHNNRRRAFEIISRNGRIWSLPYAKLVTPPSKDNKISTIYVDKELGSEGFTVVLSDGTEQSVMLDAVLDYNRDPEYLRESLLYKLTLAAQDRLKETKLSRREIIRCLNTSASQFYRLIDQTNYKKSVGQMLKLLDVLGCDVDLIISDREAA